MIYPYIEKIIENRNQGKNSAIFYEMPPKVMQALRIIGFFVDEYYGSLYVVRWNDS